MWPVYDGSAEGVLAARPRNRARVDALLLDARLFEGALGIATASDLKIKSEMHERDEPLAKH